MVVFAGVCVGKYPFRGGDFEFLLQKSVCLFCDERSALHLRQEKWLGLQRSTNTENGKRKLTAETSANRSVARNRAPDEEARQSLAYRGCKLYAVRSRTWQGQTGKAESQEIRAGSGGKCTCALYGQATFQNIRTSKSRGKRRRCRSVPKVKPLK